MATKTPSNTNINRQDNGTIEITLSIPWANIQTEYEKAVVEAVNSAEISGFRKGKAPRDMVEPRLDKNQLYSHAVQHLLPALYEAAVKENSLKPILYPQIRLTKGEEGNAWEFVATTCEAPEIALGDLKAHVKQVTPEPADSKLTRILEAIKSQVQVKIPDMLAQEEANHRLGVLADNLTKLGLNTDGYLQSKKLTPEQLRANTIQEARTDLEMEFILAAVQTQHKLADRKATLDFLTGLI